MQPIVRRFEGEDLVITAADLQGIGVRVGQYLAIRPMQALPLALPLDERELAESRARRQAMDAAWAAASLAEEVDAECEREAMWERWAV